MNGICGIDRVEQMAFISNIVHVWGTAGSGKTLLASHLASRASQEGTIEWISTDSKRGSLQVLRNIILKHEGRIENVMIQTCETPDDAYSSVLSLKGILTSNHALVVIDTITSVLDMARIRPSMWGREMIEEILPVLASLSNRFSIPIIMTNECRVVKDDLVQPVFYRVMKRWADCDIMVDPEYGTSSSRIILFRSDDEEPELLGRLETANLALMPKQQIDHDVEEAT